MVFPFSGGTNLLRRIALKDIGLLNEVNNDMYSAIVEENEVYELVPNQTYLIIRLTKEEVVGIGKELKEMPSNEHGFFAEFWNHIMHAHYKIEK